MRRLIALDLRLFVEGWAQADPKDRCAIRLSGIQQRRQFLLADELRSQEVVADQQHADLGTGKGLFDLRLPLLAWLNFGIVPNINDAPLNRWSEHCLELLEQLLVFVTVADEDLVALGGTHRLILDRTRGSDWGRGSALRSLSVVRRDCFALQKLINCSHGSPRQI